jgi:hypothetical protein
MGQIFLRPGQHYSNVKAKGSTKWLILSPCATRHAIEALKSASSALLIMRPSYLTLSAYSAEYYSRGLKGEGNRLW